MSADPRSNEDIIAEAIDDCALVEMDRDQRVAAMAEARRVVAALSAADRHVVSEGEAVIDGQRGRLVLVPSLKWTGPTGHEIPGFAVAAFQPLVPSEPVSPGADRP